MNKSYTFTLIFMIVIALAFSTVLAVANFLAQPAITANQEYARQSAIVYALDVPVAGKEKADTEAAYATYIKEHEQDGFTYYERVTESGETAGYAVYYEGSGLWGAIKGYLAVTPDLETMQGLVFLEQNETPGLGGRIDEPVFKEQFRGQSIVDTVAYGDGIDAVTGATASSTAVLKIVNDVRNNELTKLEAILNEG